MRKPNFEMLKNEYAIENQEIALKFVKLVLGVTPLAEPLISSGSVSTFILLLAFWLFFPRWFTHPYLAFPLPISNYPSRSYNGPNGPKGPKLKIK